MKLQTKDVLAYLLPIVAVVVFWQILAAVFYSEVLPTPLSVVRKIAFMATHEVAEKTLYRHIGRSLFRMGSGLVIGISLGVPLGIFMGWNRYFEAAVKPLFETFRMVPALSWIPLSVLFFGTSEFGKIFIIFVASFPPAVLNSWRGVRLVDPDLVTAAKILGARDFTIMKSVILPSALPSIFAGVQYAVSISWMAILAAELVAAGEGLGFITYYGMEIPDTAMIAAGMLVIGLIGFSISQVLRHCEGVITPWK